MNQINELVSSDKDLRHEWVKFSLINFKYSQSIYD